MQVHGLPNEILGNLDPLALIIFILPYFEIIVLTSAAILQTREVPHAVIHVVVTEEITSRISCNCALSARTCGVDMGGGLGSYLREKRMWRLGRRGGLR